MASRAQRQKHTVTPSPLQATLARRKGIALPVVRAMDYSGLREADWPEDVVLRRRVRVAAQASGR